MKKFSYILVTSVVTPFGAAAASINNLNDIFIFIRSVLNAVLPLIIALAVVYFIWGIFQYVVAADEEKKGQAKDKVIYGIVGIFIMISVWGLVNILANTFGLSNNNRGNDVNQQLPNVPSI